MNCFILQVKHEQRQRMSYENLIAFHKLLLDIAYLCKPCQKSSQLHVSRNALTKRLNDILEF